MSQILLVPGYTIIKFGTTATEDVERAADRQVDLTVTHVSHEVKILHCARAAGVCDRYAAPFRQPPHQLDVDALLETFVVGSMNEELGAVRL